MEQTITRFVHALRNAEIDVSPAETLDAVEVLNAVGVADLTRCKNALSLALAKSPEDKVVFDRCFERFFALTAFVEPPKATVLRGINQQALLAAITATAPSAAELIRWVLSVNQTQLSAKLIEASEHAGLHELRYLRDKGPLVRKIGSLMGLDALSDVQTQLGRGQSAGVNYLRQYVEEEIKRFVDAQFDLVADQPAKAVLLARTLEARLQSLPRDFQADAQQAISEFADRLKNRHKKRRTRARRGQLNVKQTLRRNVAYDGTLIEMAFKKKRKEEGTIYLLCDVSGSMAQISRFMLLIIHHLHDLLPKVRSFAFSSEMGEITDYFGQGDPQVALERVVFDWGSGNTDYGRAFRDFRNEVHQELNRRSTIVVLGDARSNFYPAHTRIFGECAHRAKRTLWLNPESRDNWSIGDSDMLRYAPHCTSVERVSTLADLKRVSRNLIQSND